MEIDIESFARVIAGLLKRYFLQNDLPVPALGARLALGRRIWALLEARGWPRPLASHERGQPRERSAEEVASMAARLLAGIDEVQRPAWAVPVLQLIKACFYPELKTCRDSYRECGPDGSCRRQELARARKRLSGTHCVDCPYWTALSPTQHVQLLARHWRPGWWAEFQAHQSVYLPEDFRRLRRMLHDKARRIRS